MAKAKKYEIIKSNKNNSLWTLFPISVGMVFLVVGIYLIVDHTKFMKEATGTVTAVITRIEEYTDSDGDTSHTAYVRYTIDGQEYDNALREYSSSMHEGGSIVLKYRPNEPNDARTANGSYIGGAISGFLGGIIVVIFAVVLIKGIVNGTTDGKIMRNGAIVLCDIVRMEYNMEHERNLRNPQFLVCKGINPNTGQMTEFETDCVYKDLRGYLGGKAIVYVLGEKYIVDLEKLLQER